MERKLVPGGNKQRSFGRAMMRAKLKELRSLELEESLAQYRPDDPSNFGTWARAMVGPENEDGAEAFDILICTPGWLKVQKGIENCRWGHPMLVVFHYDFGQIESFIKGTVEQCSADDWQGLVQKLSRFGAWEFDNYQSNMPG